MEPDRFVRTIRNYTSENGSESKYAFFIGAGCSISSGIPGAASLVKERWIPDLQRIIDPSSDSEPLVWADEYFGIDVSQITPDIYGRIMAERFQTPQLRQDEIENLCAYARPKFGYATLAQLMSSHGGRFNVAISTNFDDLLIDSLYLFADVHPRIIHHSALSAYVRPSTERTMVVKLHGHHQFSALNLPLETATLDQDLTATVQSLLHDRGLIFVGYSGSDVGVRRLLEDLPQTALPYGVFWVSGSEPKGDIRNWLANRNAIWVHHHGFDELMVHVRSEFRFESPNRKRVIGMFDVVEQDYLELRSRLLEKVAKLPDQQALKSAVEQVDSTIEDWGIYELLARKFKSTDPLKAREAYEQGLNKFPNSVPLHGNFANFLKDQGQFDEAEKHYQTALEINPDYPIVLHDYAIFLWRSAGKLDQAKEYMRKAMALDSADDAIRLSNYARFQWEVYRDLKLANWYFEASLAVFSVAPEVYTQYGLYAQFERLDFTYAEHLYVEALKRKSDDLVAIINYASLMVHIGELDAAEAHYRRAYAIGGDDHHVIKAYAIFHYYQRKDRALARQLFEQYRAWNPPGYSDQREYASIMALYASFLAEESAGKESGLALIQALRSRFPDDSNLIANHANFLAFEMNEVTGAVSLLDQSILNHDSEGVLIGTKALILSQSGQNIETTKEMYRAALKLDPGLTAYACNLAGAMMASGESEEGLNICRPIIRRVGRNIPLQLLECFFYIYIHGETAEQRPALRMIRWLVDDGIVSPHFDLTGNVAAAIAASHPAGEWLAKLAQVIGGGHGATDLLEWPDWSQSEPSPHEFANTFMGAHLVDD
jgi:Tfp pilus assembly protein PilF